MSQSLISFQVVCPPEHVELFEQAIGMIIRNAEDRATSVSLSVQPYDDTEVEDTTEERRISDLEGAVAELVRDVGIVAHSALVKPEVKLEVRRDLQRISRRWENSSAG